jgi:phage FluMu protein Com
MAAGMDRRQPGGDGGGSWTLPCAECGRTVGNRDVYGYGNLVLRCEHCKHLNFYPALSAEEKRRLVQGGGDRPHRP